MPGPVNPLVPGLHVTNKGLEIADGTSVRATLGQLPDGTYGLLIYNGAIELIDQFGQTVMSNGAFAGPMLDFIRSGIYNNMFVAGISGTLPIGTSRDDAAGHTANCPGWTIWRSSGAASATRVSDTTYPGGAYIELDFAATGTATTNDIALTTDLFPITPSGRLGIRSFESWSVPSGVTLQLDRIVDFYSAAGVWLSNASIGLGPAGASTRAPGNWSGPDLVVPANARFARATWHLYESAGHSAATYYRLGAALAFIANDTSISSIAPGQVTAAGALAVAGSVGFYGTTPASKQTVTGSKGSNAALGSLLSALAALGLITDSSS